MLIIYVNKNDDNDKSLAIALEIAIKKLELCLQSLANSQEILNIFSTFYSFFEKKHFLE